MRRCELILVSACLAGVRCRWDGRSSTSRRVARLVAEGRAVPVCPEQLGGLPTPRPPAEIEAGDGRDVLQGRSRVVSKGCCDLTRSMVRGAREAARLVRMMGIRCAILKEGSPSCGVRSISRGGRSVRGQGILSALLDAMGLRVEGVR